MKVKVISFGKIKDPNIKQLIFYYQKLTSKYVDLNLIILKDTGKKIDLKNIEKLNLSNSKTFILDERGKGFTTLEFAETIKNLNLDSRNINFIIANAFGFTSNVINNKNFESLALSKFTLPHEFVQVILLEQLFRIFNYLNGGKYHK